MAKDVIITPSDGDIQFENSTGTEAGKIEQSGDDLVLSNAVGDILIGDGTADVYIGDGAANVDIVFEQNGSIRGETGSSVDITLGSSDTDVIISGSTFNIDPDATFSGLINAKNKLTFTTSNGYVLFDHQPQTGVGEYTSEVPLLRIDYDGSEKTILSRTTGGGAITIGADDSVVIAGGDTKAVIKANLNLGAENVIFSSETGFHAYGFPNNSTTWANRQEFRFYTGGTDASLNGLWIGDGGNTQFIDLSRNLINIGTINSGEITTNSKIISTAAGSLLRKFVSTWTNATTHDLIYQGWHTNTDDYIYLKSPGNSTTNHGIAFIGDNVIALGRTDAETGAPELTSATAPISENWFVLNSTSATFAGNIVMAANATVDGVDISALPTTFAPTNAEQNVQADWNETTNTSDAFILNKPTIPTDHGDHDGLYLPIGGGTLTGNLSIPEYLYHAGDTNTYVRLRGDDLQLVAGGRNILRMDEGTDPDKIQLGDSSTVTYTEGSLGVGTDTPTETDFGSLVPKLHVKQSDTAGEFNLIARFEAGSDANDTGGAILINHSNDRGILIEGGRGGAGTIPDDDAVSHFGLVASNGTNTRVITLRQKSALNGSLYGVGIGTETPTTKLDVDGVIRSRGGTYAADTDTKTDVGLVIPENNFIYTADGSDYLRKLIGKYGDVIDIGESGTSLTDGINLKPGTTGGYVQIFNNSSIAAKFVDGKLGIGTTNPQQKLHIDDGNLGLGLGEEVFGIIAPNNPNFGLDFIIGDGAVAGDTPIMSLKSNGGQPEGTVQIYGSGSTVLDIQGTSGQLFSITDDLTGDLFTVSDISGVPIFNVNADGTSYFDDKVGIGETNPSHKLDIKQGELRISNDQQDPQIILEGADMGRRWVLSQDEEDNIGSTGFYIAEGANVDANDALLYLTPDGDLGIGTTGPNHKLEVAVTDTVALANQPAEPLHVSNNGVSVDGRVLISVKHSAINTASAIGAGFKMTAGAVTSGTPSYFDSLIYLESAAPGSDTIHSAPRAIKFYVDNHATSAGSGTGYNALGDLAMTIAESANVGIGTTSPQSKLHVLGTTTIPSAGSDGGAAVFGNTTNTGYGLVLGTETSGKSYIQSQRNDGTATTYDLLVQPNGGKVGIGTTSPSTLLHTKTLGSSSTVPNELRIESVSTSGYGGESILNLYTSTYGNPGIYFGNQAAIASQPANIKYTGSSSLLNIETNGSFQISRSSSTKQVITSNKTYFINNNVGIHNTAPSTELEVSGTTTTENLAFKKPTADNQFRGEIVTFGSQSGIAQGDIVAYNSSGQWVKAQANSDTTSKNLLGVAMGTTAAAGILLRGFVRDASFGNQTPSSGQHLYLSTSTAGDYQTAVPNTTGHVARVIGYSIAPTNEEIYFCPDNTFVEIA